MIRAKIVMTRGTCYVRTEGHAHECEPTTDEELIEGVAVCAAVSAIMQSAAYSLQAVAAKHPDLLKITLCDMPEGAARILPSEYDGAKTSIRSEGTE